MHDRSHSIASPTPKRGLVAGPDGLFVKSSKGLKQNSARCIDVCLRAHILRAELGLIDCDSAEQSVNVGHRSGRDITVLF